MKAPAFFAILASTTFACSIAAQATDTSTAISLCKENPNCHMRDATTFVTMTVNGNAGGKSIVVCPMPSGTCVAQRGRSQHGARIEATLRCSQMLIATCARSVDDAVARQPSN